jgi:hypothetical protein
MVINSLHNISGHSGIKEAYGSFISLIKKSEIMEILILAERWRRIQLRIIQFPFFQEKHDLCKKNKINKVNILVLYSDVYNTWVRNGKISESKLPAKVLLPAE